MAGFGIEKAKWIVVMGVGVDAVAKVYRIQ
jgi:hypothetical protein